MITVLSTPDCVFCHALMAWLEKNDIEFEEVDLSDKKMLKKFEKQYDRDFKSVPVTIIGDEIIEGFDRPAIKRALKKQQ